ncbi:MAG: putative lipid kinase BmrU [Bacteroidetes bacterium ADurb.Bin234]|nr:MAG: putative lipid kinase BmrU [Bacteroidetes bacterium ADurb.Bin234]
MELQRLNVYDYQWQVIINPNALSEKCLAYWVDVEKQLGKLGIPYRHHIADESTFGIKKVEELCKKGERYFIVVGGDGTINEVINGIFISGVNPEEVYVSVFPLGTGNDWTRTHAYPSSYSDTILSFQEAKFIKHDVGLVECVKDNLLIEKRYFVNIAGFGFDAEVIEEVNKNKSKLFTKTVYILSLLKVLLRHKNKKNLIKLDNESINDEIFTLAVGIGQYNGNGMRQVPTANPVDGLFDVAVVRKISPLKVIKNVSKLYDGTHIKVLKEASVSQSKTVEIKSSPYCRGEVEGELLPLADYRISIIPRAVNMMSMAENW